MSELLSAAKGIKALHEASEILFIPATILAIWSQAAPFLIEVNSGSVVLAIGTCCVVGILCSLIAFQAISWTGWRLNNLPVYTGISISLIAGGLIVLFQDYMPVKFNAVTPFTGFCLVAWGFMLDSVHDRVRAKSSKA